MILDGQVLGRPLISYKDTQTAIEALTGVVAGMTAYATDTGLTGYYTGASWVWLSPTSGSYVPIVHDITGAYHSTSGRTSGQVLQATGAATFGWSTYALTISAASSISGTAIVGAPGTLTASTTNAAADPHTHAITSSSNPGAAARILASDASGFVQLEGLGVGIAPTVPLAVKASQSFATLGADKVTNGSFSTGDFTGWTAGAGWSVVANKAVCAAGSATALSQSITVTSGKKYVIYFDWNRASGFGVVEFAIGTVKAYPFIVNSAATNLTCTLISNATGSVSFSITPTATSGDVTVDNIRIYEVSAVIPATATYYDASGVASFDVRAIESTNVAVGTAALSNIVPLVSPSGVGYIGTSNVAVGGNSLEDTTTGYANTAIGSQNMRRLLDGINNIAIGSNVAASGEHFSGNVMIGGSSSVSISQGQNNVAIGFASMYTNTSASLNVAVGYNALYKLNNTTAGGSNTYNVAIGPSAGANVTTGTFNTLLGASVGGGITTGTMNVVAGWSAGNTVNKSNSVLLGPYSGQSVGSNSVCVGYHAGSYETGSSKLFIDAYDRTNEAGGREKALIYGVFSTSPAAQTLDVNALLTARMTSATTNAAVEVARIEARSTGTAAAGFGPQMTMYGEDGSTDTYAIMSSISSIWNVATHASAVSDVVFSAAYNSGAAIVASEFLRGRGNAGIIVTGSQAGTYTTTDVDLTLTATHHWVRVTAAKRITLPTAVGISGREYLITATVNNVIVDAATTELINGSLTQVLMAGDSIQIKSDNAGWKII